MKVPLKILIKRDIKNLYKKALQKKIKNVVGMILSGQSQQTLVNNRSE